MCSIYVYLTYILLCELKSSVDHRDLPTLIQLQSFFSTVNTILVASYCHEMHWAGKLGGQILREHTYSKRYRHFIITHLHSVQLLLDHEIIAYSENHQDDLFLDAPQELRCDSQTYANNMVNVDVVSYMVLQNMGRVLKIWKETLQDLS